MRKALMYSFVLVVSFAVSAAAQDPKAAASPTSEMEKQFVETLSGAALVGHFTTRGQLPSEKLSEERYEISRVTKLPDKEDMYRFKVRIKYGRFDVNVPLDLKVIWAGDTPLITLTDYKIPALGTFSARVMIFRDQYAGTWQHGEVGGHLFGRVVRDRKVATPPETESATKDTKQ